VWRESYCIAGVTFSLEGTDPLLRVLARSVYSSALVESRASECAYALGRVGARISLRAADGGEVFRVDSLAGAFAEIEWLFTRLAMTRSTGYLQVHAAAAVWRGHGLLLVGPSDSGKTTLAVALGVRGAGILTDEIALIRPRDRSVTPFPRDLALSWRTRLLLQGRHSGPPPRSWKSFSGYEHCSLAELGFPPAPEGGRITAVVLLERGSHLDSLLRPAGPAEAARWILEQSFNLGRWGQVGMTAVADLVEQAPSVHLRWRDPDDAASALLGYLGTR